MSSEEQQAETLYETTNRENNIFSGAIHVVRFEKCMHGTFLFLLINTWKDYSNSFCVYFGPFGLYVFFELGRNYHVDNSL